MVMALSFPFVAEMSRVITEFLGIAQPMELFMNDSVIGDTDWCFLLNPRSQFKGIQL